MRNILISVAVASAALVASPATAQGYYGGHGYHGGQGYYGGQGYHGGQYQQVHRQLDRDISQLENRIQRSAQRGRLSRGEAISLSRAANALRHDFYRFSRNGLDQGEIRNLAIRLDRLNERLRFERRDGNRYDDRRW